MPRRPVTIIVPYAPGGGTDTAARMMAAGLERELNAAFQVVNRAGAASQIGLTELTRARPDGLTLAYAILPTVVTHYRDPQRPGPLHARELPAGRDALHFHHDAVGARRLAVPHACAISSRPGAPRPAGSR